MADEQRGPRQQGRWIAGAIALVLLALAGRATFEQLSAFDRAVAAEADGRPDDAIVEYRWTLRWTTPWGPRDSDAAAALIRIADAAEAARPERAAFALDALRSGAIASRWLVQPHSEAISLANARLPGLWLRVAERRGDTRDKDALRRRFEADVARPVGVPGWLALLVALGFCVWLYGLWRGVRESIDEDGQLQRGGWRWFATSAAGMATWALALWLG
ncbi:MAG: hypothetical protein RIT45_1454 [Pseudomonadota bacterium]|jgi:hypothetical protein